MTLGSWLWRFGWKSWFLRLSTQKVIKVIKKSSESSKSDQSAPEIGITHDFHYYGQSQEIPDLQSCSESSCASAGVKDSPGRAIKRVTLLRKLRSWFFEPTRTNSKNQRSKNQQLRGWLVLETSLTFPTRVPLHEPLHLFFDK